MYLKDKSTREHPKAKIKYFVKAKVLSVYKEDEMKYK